MKIKKEIVEIFRKIILNLLLMKRKKNLFNDLLIFMKINLGIILMIIIMNMKCNEFNKTLKFSVYT